MTKGQLIVLWVFGLLIALVSLLTVTAPGVLGFLVIIGALFFISLGNKR